MSYYRIEWKFFCDGASCWQKYEDYKKSDKKLALADFKSLKESDSKVHNYRLKLITETVIG